MGAGLAAVEEVHLLRTVIQLVHSVHLPPVLLHPNAVQGGLRSPEIVAAASAASAAAAPAVAPAAVASLYHGVLPREAILATYCVSMWQEASQKSVEGDLAEIVVPTTGHEEVAQHTNRESCTQGVGASCNSAACSQ